MNNFLPSRRLVLFLIASSIIIIAYLSLSEYDKQNYIGTDKNQKGEIKIVTNNTKVSDLDGDGLKDWQEFLYKTDPNNPDTDNDSISDSDEIGIGQNPLIIGLSDKTGLSSADGDIKLYENSTITETDKLARRFFSGYIGLKQNNQLNTQNQDKLVNTLIEQSIQEIKTREYTLKDLNIIKDTDKSNIDAYKENIRPILLKLLRVKENEIFVFASAVKDNDQSQYEKLNFSVLVYKEVVDDLLKLETPEEISLIHLEITNNLNKLAECVRGMSSAEDDPIVAIKSVGDLESIEGDLRSSAQKLAVYLSAMNN